MREKNSAGLKSTLLLSIPFLFSACVSLPDVYLIDRHTAMEAEASGEWPEVDQRVRDEAIKPGPTMLQQTENSARKERTFQILNSEFTSESQP